MRGVSNNIKPIYSEASPKLKNFSSLHPQAGSDATKKFFVLALPFGFIVGIWFSSLWSFGFVVPIFILFFAILFLASSFWFHHEERQWLRALALFFLCFALGSARAELKLINQKIPAWTAGQIVTVEGRVAEEPKPSETTNQVVVETPEKFRLLLITDLYPEYRYGEQLKIFGKIVEPKGDYKNYLVRQDIFFEMFRPAIEKTPGVKDASTPGVKMQSSLIWMRGKFMRGIERILPEPQAGLLGGLLIGAKSSMDKNLLEDFRRVGLSHMVVLSGYNLSIVAEAARVVFGFLPFYLSLGVAGTSILIFALMAGGGAAVGRAALMALFALFARATGRIYEVTRALVFTIIALLLWNPNYLVFDLGFQLSVLATLGLLFLTPLLAKFFRRAPARLGIREILTSTVAAQLAVLPWLLYKMGQLSIISFVANPLVLLAVPPIMFWGFILTVTSWVSTLLAFVPGAIAYLLLSYQLALVNFFARLPFASFKLSQFPLVIALAIYAFYFYWYHRSFVILKE